MSDSLDLRPGPGVFRVTDHHVLPGKRIPVHYYLPTGFGPDSPILFVMHGTRRNASDYRDTWIATAERENALLLCPRFSRRHYSRHAYHLGNVVAESEALPPERWTFEVIEDLFDKIRAATGSTREHYDIYGHSAGAQFVHRLVLFCPHVRIGTAVAANAGWYTLPAFDGHAFPYGLRRSPATPYLLDAALGRKLVIMVGCDDRDADDAFLRNSRRACAQGEHRFERAHTFLRRGREHAADREIPCRWSLVTVAGAGHHDVEMMPAATEVLYGEASSIRSVS